MPEPDAVAITDLWFSYDRQPVLRDVTLRIAPGDRAFLVGPNGGGKTTLLKLILGLLKPDRGTVRVFGQAPGRARRRIGYAPQHTLFDPHFPASVMDVALMGRLGRTGRLGAYGKADRAAVAEALEEVGLYELRGRRFSDLSSGQRQRVLIARALAPKPDLLLLDEPTANLDVGIESEFHDLLARLGRRMTLVLVSHDVGFVLDLATKAVCVRGTVAVHPTAELTGDLMSELYGQDVRLIRHDHDCLRQCPEGEPRD